MRYLQFLIILLFLSLTCIRINAQVRTALVAGPQFSNIQEKNSLPNWSADFKPYYQSRTSLSLGFLFQVPLSPSSDFTFEPGMLLASKGNKFDRFYDSSSASRTDTLFFRQEKKIGYIEFPLNIAYTYRFAKSSQIRFSAGPYISFFRKGKRATEFRSYQTKRYLKDELEVEAGKGPGKIKTADFGWNARITVDFGKLFLSAWHSQGLSNFSQADYPATFHHQVTGFSLGLWLNKPIPRKPKDRDHDGVADLQDLCPSIPGTAATNGCPDKDNDRVADQVDQCPDIAGLAKYKGCPPPDSDKDGINDEEDQCPTKAGSKKYQGCPVPDTDLDGINDEEDQCPTKRGSIKYKGCPIPDSDLDGLNDEEDQCPKQAGPAANKGCPIPDRDEDGVNDEEDRCPDLAGKPDLQGCPEIQSEIKEQVDQTAQRIFFAINSATLQPRSHATLDSLVVLLRDHPLLQLDIFGHTDNYGLPEYNREFSQKRAEAIKTYLQSKGIAAERLYAKGFGSTQPVGDNKTREGRAQNRRVELQVHYGEQQK